MDEEEIVKLLNKPIEDRTEEERLVCEDYFCTNYLCSDDSDSECSDIENKEDETDLAERLSNVEEFNMDDIPTFEEIEKTAEDLTLTDVVVEEVVCTSTTPDDNTKTNTLFEEEGDRHDLPIWEPVLQSELQDEFDAEIRAMKVEGCCKRKCSDSITLDELLRHFFDSKQLDYYVQGTNQLDLVILGQIRGMCRTQDAVKTGKGSVVKERRRLRMIYTFGGSPVCEKLFLAVNAIKIKRFKRILKHFKQFGMEPPVHKNFKRTPKKTYTKENLENVVHFIRNYAEESALFMPGRLAQHKNIVKLLPSSDTKYALYKKYKDICIGANETYVGLSTFKNIWLTFCCDVVIMKPRSDLCDFCQKSMTTFVKLRGSSEEEKAEFINKCHDHLNTVNIERTSYKTLIKDTFEKFDLMAVQTDENGVAIPNTYDGEVHYSFDYAQQVHIPFDSQQPGPIYFLTPFKVGLFGIMNDTRKVQNNFLIPESVQISKGANAIVSFLHYYLQKHSSGEKHLRLHADNCVSQNKNNIVIGYLIWRVLNDLNETITLSFLPVGHTKFSCDWAFGLFKKKFRRGKASSLNQVSQILEESAITNKSIITGTEQGDILVPIYDWLHYFSKKNWKPIKHITKYSHFLMNCDNKGLVRTKTSLCSEQVEHVVTTDLDMLDDFPSEIKPDGLSNARKDYLYKKIRPFCEEEYKDVLCPNPGLQPQDDADKDEDVDDPLPPPAKKSKLKSKSL